MLEFNPARTASANSLFEAFKSECPDTVENVLRAAYVLQSEDKDSKYASSRLRSLLYYFFAAQYIGVITVDNETHSVTFNLETARSLVEQWEKDAALAAALNRARDAGFEQYKHIMNGKKSATNKPTFKFGL